MTGDTQPLRILNADDDDAGRYAVTRLLQRAGYAVTEAASGAEALRLAAEHLPDLLLLDRHLLDMDGCEVCRRLRADPATASLPILHLSVTATDDEAVVQGLEGRADAYLAEPADPRVFLAMVKALLRVGQAQQALRESQALLQTIVTGIPDPIYAKDRQSRIILANPALAEVVGKPLEEILGRTDAEYFGDAATGQALREHDLRVITSGASEVTEETVPTPRGPRTFLSTKAPYRTACGDIIGIVGVSRDVTERKQAEQALRENEARLFTLAEAMPHMVWSADASGEIDYFNRRAYAYGGAPEGGAHNWHLSPIVHPEDKTRTYWAWRRAFKRGDAYEIEHRLRRADGQYRWHLTRGLPVRNEAGSIVRWIGTATDIHEQKQTEEALRESEARYRRLFGTMQEGLCIVEAVTDAQGRPVDLRYVDVNPTMERYHGGAREHMVGHTYAELVPNADPEWIAILGSVALTGEPRSGERHAPVTGRWLRYHAYSPQAGQCAFVFEDITDHKQAEQALLRKEAELREAQRVAHVGSWYWDIETDAVTASPEIFRMVGLDPEAPMSVLREREIEFYTPESHQRVFAAVQLALATGTGYELDVEARRTDGTPLWISVRAETVRSPDGRIVALRGTNQDITARKQAEQGLQESSARVRRLVDSNIIGVIFSNAAGDIAEANDAFLRMVGYSREDLLAGLIRWRDMTPPEHLPKDEQALREARQSGRCTPYQKEYWRRDGSRVPVLIGFATLEGSQADYVCFILDLSVRRRVEEERERLHEQLLAAERARAEIAEHLNDEISHRVKNNLAMISGLLQMQVLSEPGPEAVTALRDAVSRVRTFASLHEEMYTRRTEEIDLLEAVRHITDTTRAVFSSHQHVDIRVHGEHIICTARDATNLSVIANELLTNALKHGAPGTDGRLRVDVRVGKTDEELTLAVANSGPPIAAGFDPRAQTSMGMNLVWDLVVEQYEGRFSLVPGESGTLAQAVVPLAHLHRE